MSEDKSDWLGDPDHIANLIEEEGHQADPFEDPATVLVKRLAQVAPHNPLKSAHDFYCLYNYMRDSQAILINVNTEEHHIAMFLSKSRGA